MSKPSIFQLVSLLTEAEQAILSDRVAGTGRKPLKNLLTLILRSPIGSSPAKEAIFIKTFGKKYTAKQDGLLRNAYAELKK